MYFSLCYFTVIHFIKYIRKYIRTILVSQVNYETKIGRYKSRTDGIENQLETLEINKLLR